MQKKLYVGGLPWEIDRIGLLNYFKAILECNDITASYEPNFTTAPISNPNSAIKVVDVFVAMDRETGKSRGFGFVTLEMPDDEQHQRMQKMRQSLVEHNIFSWAAQLLRTLTSIYR